MSHDADLQSGERVIQSAYDDPGTYEEITRRKFMAYATVTLSGIIGLGLVIPIAGSVVTKGLSGSGTWTPLDRDALQGLGGATSTPVKLTLTLKTKDGYLPERPMNEFVWGIKTDEAKMRKARPNLFTSGKSALPYPVVTLGFVIFSPICPHLGCRFDWNAGTSKFLCPCHGSQYDLEGAHTAGPAPRGLDPLPLRERSGHAEITWIRYRDSLPDHIVVSYAS